MFPRSEQASAHNKLLLGCYRLALFAATTISLYLTFDARYRDFPVALGFVAALSALVDAIVRRTRHEPQLITVDVRLGMIWLALITILCSVIVGLKEGLEIDLGRFVGHPFHHYPTITGGEGLFVNFQAIGWSLLAALQKRASSARIPIKPSTLARSAHSNQSCGVIQGPTRWYLGRRFASNIPQCAPTRPSQVSAFHG